MSRSVSRFQGLCFLRILNLERAFQKLARKPVSTIVKRSVWMLVARLQNTGPRAAMSDILGYGYVSEKR